MYTRFFGLRELPFNNTPDPRFFYSTPEHEEALASLIYAVSERKGFILLTGEVGSGKTLTARMMLRHFNTRINFATVSHGLGDARDLMESVCTEFDLAVPAGASCAHLARMLHDYLMSQFAQNTPVVLVLDEAQNLPIDAFEQLRMIGNLEADDAKLLQIVIIGQPELQSTFMLPELRQLRQRIFRSFHLPALSQEQTAAYVQHRLRIAGATQDEMFDAGAIKSIHRYSQGLPRLINSACDNALLSAYSADVQRVDTDLVETVVAQMMTIGPLVSQPETMPPSSPAPSCAPVMPQRRRIADIAGQGMTEESREAVQAVALRVANVEARLDDQKAELQSLRQGVGEIHEGLRTNTARFAEKGTFGESSLQFVQSQVEELSGKITGLRDAVATVPAMVGHAETIKNDLLTAVEDAGSVLKRVDGASAKLHESQCKIGALVTRFGTIKSEVRSSVAALEATAEKVGSIERQAQRTTDRISEESMRTVQIASTLQEMLAKFTDVTQAKLGGDSVSHPAVDAPARSALLTRLNGALGQSRAQIGTLSSLLAGSRPDAGRPDVHRDQGAGRDSGTSPPSTVRSSTTRLNASTSAVASLSKRVAELTDAVNAS